MENQTASKSYMDNIREVATRVTIGFYNNSAEDIGDLHINRSGWSINTTASDGSAIPPEVVCSSDDWFFLKRKQLFTYGMETRKYGTVDGYTTLDGSCVLANTSPSGIMGLWGDVCSYPNGSTDGLPGTFPANKNPVLTLLFKDERELSQILVVGNTAWNQYPVSYDIVVYPIADKSRSALAPPDAVIKNVHKIPGREVTENGQLKIVYSVENGTAVEQEINFVTAGGAAQMLKFKKVLLVIRKWSAPGACAKILYFSRDKNMLIEASEIKALNVFEEKTPNLDKLSYGITGNSCTLQLKNTENRFSGNRGLIKKNKLIIPSVGLIDGAKDAFEGVEGQLGRFYTKSWEMASGEGFVTCKAHDALYGLQELKISYPIPMNSDGKYVIPAEISVKQLLEDIRIIINDAKKQRGDYGVDLIFRIDPLLQNVTVPLAIIGEKSAWEVLQDIAEFALCHIYCNRLGEVIVTCDTPPVGMPLTAKTQVQNCSINTKNAFSFSVPIQSKTVVNRVTVPYYKMEKGKVEDDKIEIQPEKITEVVYTENGAQKKKYTFEAKLKVYYKEISGYELICKTNEATITLNDYIIMCRIFADKVYLELINIPNNVIGKILQMAINPTINKLEGTGCKLTRADYVTDDSLNKMSIEENGISEYKAQENMLIIEKEQAKNIADKILAKYGSGVNYIETNWIGSPELALNKTINCKGINEKEYSEYESVSNEITLNGSLRMKSKLRKV